MDIKGEYLTITALHQLVGQLTYGPKRPTLIRGDEKAVDALWWRIVRGAREKGFFASARVVVDATVPARTLIVTNEDFPLDAKLNGSMTWEKD